MAGVAARLRTSLKLGYGSPVVDVHGNGPAALAVPVECRGHATLYAASTLSDKLRRCCPRSRSGNSVAGVELTLQRDRGLPLDDHGEALEVIESVGPVARFWAAGRRAGTPRSSGATCWQRATRSRGCGVARLAEYDPPDDLDAIILKQRHGFCCEGV
jgi:hypothetical protein